MSSNDLKLAAEAWSVVGESLTEINARIHDGVDIDQLEARADGFARSVLDTFPYVRLGGCRILEIGSGTGFIIEAINRKICASGAKPPHITGLDISESMIAAAKARMRSNPAFAEGRLDFQHYDGLRIPFADDTFDIIYSVAALQHVPKPFVYNLFFEARRIVKPHGAVILNLLPFKNLEHQESLVPWKEEIENQVGATSRPGAHWHHFYSRDEIQAVMTIGTKFKHVNITEPGGLMMVCAMKSLPEPPVGFSVAGYVRKNPDLAGVQDPLAHYFQYGFAEGRSW